MTNRTSVSPTADKGAPSLAAIIAAGVAGAAQIINTLVLTSTHERPIRDAITVFLTMVAAYGISPLTGASFRNALHLPYRVTVIISVAIIGLNGLLIVIHMSTLAHTIIAAIITVAAGLGFGAANTSLASTTAPGTTPLGGTAPLR